MSASAVAMIVATTMLARSASAQQVDTRVNRMPEATAETEIYRDCARPDGKPGLVGCAGLAAARAPTTGTRATLVIFLTVDQMRADYIERFLPHLTGGLARLYRNGAVFTNGFQDHGITETAPGHASVLSGRYPRSTGIVANDAGVLDPQEPLIGSPGDPASPYRFRGSTLIDWMRTADPRARALSVSRKDRAAILPIGRAHQLAIWYAGNGWFTTSRYYADTLPYWLTAFNAQRIPAMFTGQSWTPLLEAAAYPEPDSVPVEGGGKDFVFPHRFPTDTSAMLKALPRYPQMDQVTLEAALAGLRALDLGKGPQADLLAISLSTTDAVGHVFGPDSKEIHDQILRLDRYLGAFMDTLAALRDSTRVVFALTGDHGVAPFPDVHSGRYPNNAARHVDVTGLVEYAAQTLPRHGVDRAAWHWDHGVLWMDRDAIRAGGLDPDSLLHGFSENLRRVPGVARVDNMRTLAARDTARDAVARRWLHTFPPDNLPALIVTLTPYSVWGNGPTAEHGSPYDYDAHVPIIFEGAPFRPGHYTASVRVVDMAPTLAATMNVRPTERIDGRVLREALRVDLVAEHDGKSVAAGTDGRAGR
jgi:predicted AlkP superfamily pyrophosphatase or phosphodiesterase